MHFFKDLVTLGVSKVVISEISSRSILLPYTSCLLTINYQIMHAYTSAKMVKVVLFPRPKVRPLVAPRSRPRDVRAWREYDKLCDNYPTYYIENFP